MFYVYLMRAGQSHYKVGVTKNLINRVKSIQTSNPNKIELVSSKLVELPYSIELELHQKLVDLASGGGSEWFTLKPEQVIELCIFIQQYPHIELSEKVLLKDLLERQLMWKKTVEKKMDIILNNYQKAIVRTIDRPTPMVENTRPIEPKLTSEEEEQQLISQARYVVIHEGKASTSLLQRKLRIGYGRAARIIEELENQGIVGPADGSRARDVLAEPVA